MLREVLRALRAVREPTRARQPGLLARPDGPLGDRSPLPFHWVVSLRTHLLAYPVPALLSLLTLVASVALACGVEMTSRSVASALRSNVERALGDAVVEVSAGDAGIPEQLLEPLRALPGVASASPLIAESFELAGGPGLGEALRIYGVDLLYADEARDFRLMRDGGAMRDPLRVLADPRSVIITAALSERYGLREGDSLPIRTLEGQTSLVVAGTLQGNLAGAFGGQLALMDVYSLQELLGREGRFDRIDIAVVEGASRAEVERRLREAVGDAGTVRDAGLRASYSDSILATLDLAVWLITVMGCLFGLVCTYTSTSVSVDRRLRDLALLRAAGMEVDSITRTVVAEAVVLGGVGSLLGIAFAGATADGFARTFSAASAYLQHIELPPASMGARTLLIGLGVGLVVAVPSGVVGAVRARRHSPMLALRVRRGGEPPGGTIRPWTTRLAAASIVGAVLVLGWSLLPPWQRLLGSLALVAISIGPAGTRLIGGLQERLPERLTGLIPRVGCLLAVHLGRQPRETSAAIAIWCVAAGTLVASFSALHDLTETIDDYWVGLNGRDAIMLFAEDPLVARDRHPVSADTWALVAATPGVSGTAPYFDLTTTIEGEDVPLVSMSIDALVEHSGGARSISSRPEQSIEALRRGELLMNRAFARRFGRSVGDRLRVATDRGVREFRIGGWGRGYAGRAGVLQMETSHLLRWFDARGADQLAFWVEGDRDEILRDIASRADQSLFFRYDRLFREHTALVVRQFNDLLLVPVALISLLAGVALMSFLVSSVMSGQRDLATVRVAGGSRGHVFALVAASGVVVAATGAGSGIAFGMLWGRTLAEAFAVTLGYDVIHHGEPALALWAGAAAVSVAFATSCIAAALARDVGVRDLSTPG